MSSRKGKKVTNSKLLKTKINIYSSIDEHGDLFCTSTVLTVHFLCTESSWLDEVQEKHTRHRRVAVSGKADGTSIRKSKQDPSPVPTCVGAFRETPFRKRTRYKGCSRPFVYEVQLHWTKYRKGKRAEGVEQPLLQVKRS